MSTETDREKKDGRIKRRNRKEETPDDEGVGEQTAMGRTPSDNE